MSADASQNKAIVLPTFSGKVKDYAVYWPRFEAYATLKGFESVLLKSTSKLPADPNVLDNDPDVKKEEELAIKLNNLAIASFTMSFTTGELMEFIEDAKTPEYGGGRADLVVENLKRKYRPTDRIAGVEAEMELINLKMNKNEDPDKYFRKLAVLKNKYRSNSSTFDNEKMIAATLSKAPSIYGSVLTSVLREKGSNLKISDLQEALKEHWRIRHNLVNDGEEVDDDDSEDEEKEMALSAMSNIKCYNCKQKGHKKNKCPLLKKNDGNKNGDKKKKFKGTCHNCGKAGHKVIDCWMLDKNKDKRPSNWKGKETGNAAMNDDELTLMCFDCHEKSDSDSDNNQDGGNDENKNEYDSSEDNDSEYDNKESEKIKKIEKQNKNNECDDECTKKHTKKGCPTLKEAKPGKGLKKRWAEYDSDDEDDDLNVKPKAESNYSKAKKGEQVREFVNKHWGEELAKDELVDGSVEELAWFDELTMNEMSNNENVNANEEGDIPYVGPTYDRDPYETDTDQSIDGGSDDLDVDGNIIPMPMRTLNAEELNVLLDDEVVDEQVLNEALAWRDSMQMVLNTDAMAFNERKTEYEENEEFDYEDDDDSNGTDDANCDGKNEVGNVAVPKTLDDISGKDFWIGDTGATTHLTNCDEGMVNTRVPTKSENIVMGNGTSASVNKIGDLLGTACNKDGDEIQKLKLHEVTHSKGAKFNLFSISAMIKKGWNLVGDKDKLELKKNGKRIVFDIKINTPKGVLFCIHIKRNRNEEAANVEADEVKKAQSYIEKALDGGKVDINKAHELLGHMGEENTRKVCKHLGIDLKKTGFKTCENCALGQGKKKNIPKKSDHIPSEEPNGRILLDISTIKKPNGNPKVKTVVRGNWRLIVDEATGYKTTDFYAKKSDMVESTCDKFNRWKQQSKPVKVVRCDNAGENYKLEERCNDKEYNLNVKFEFTARNTPQQNSKAEKGFDVLYGRGRAMMQSANIPIEMRYKLFREVFHHATKLDNLVVTTINGKTATRYEHFGEELPKFVKNMKTWGGQEW